MPRCSPATAETSKRLGFLGPALLCLILTFAARVPAEDGLPIYFEWGPPLHDYLNLGGADINPNQSCSNASGGVAVGGFDVVGEWIEIQFTLPTAGRYELGASFRSASGLSNSFALGLRPAAGGESQGIEIGYVGAGTS